MKSYFFIPANSLHKLQKSTSLKANYIIADLEDAVAYQEYESAINNLVVSTDFKIDYVRVDPDRLVSDEIHQKLFSKYKNVLYPKISCEKSFHKFVEFTHAYDVEIFLLVEHPWLLVNLNRLISEPSLRINKISFGNHDYSKVLGVDVYSEIVKFARMQVATLASAYSIECIDIASMELSNKDMFQGECMEGKKMGYSGKFIIHPKQLEWFETVEYYSNEIVQWAKDVVRILGSAKDEIAISTLNGQVIEKPHLIKAKQILKLNKI